MESVPFPYTRRWTPQCSGQSCSGCTSFTPALSPFLLWLQALWGQVQPLTQVCTQLLPTGFWFWALKEFFNSTQGILKSGFLKLGGRAVTLTFLPSNSSDGKCPLRLGRFCTSLYSGALLPVGEEQKKAQYKCNLLLPSESQRSWCINTPGFSPQPHFPVLAGLFILGNQFAHTLIGRVRLSTHILQKKGRQDEELFVAVWCLGRLLGDHPRGR